MLIELGTIAVEFSEVDNQPPPAGDGFRDEEHA
jgi:hypothetical protein